jgi:two-component system, NarL family, invasion response regulator UvrY
MKILLADDHTVLREGVKSVLNTFPNNIVVDEATTGKETLEKLKNGDYDLLILDISLPDINGLEVLQRIKDASMKSRVAILSFHAEEQFATRAFKLGAIGYINKNSSFEELRNAFEQLIQGKNYISHTFAEQLAFGGNEDILPHESLSDRELQIMLMIAGGKSLSNIADKLCIADKTVSTYRARVLEKMQLQNNAELTIYAIKNGLIQ